MSEHDSVALGREGGLKSGRSRRINGNLAGTEQMIVDDLPHATKEQRAAARRRLVNMIRDIDDMESIESI